MKNQALSCLEVTLGGMVAIVILSGLYTFIQLKLASRSGIYETPETGIRFLANRDYSLDHQVRILYAGTNSFDGSKPHVWFVIYEVRAASRADGSPLRKNGCHSGSRFFLDTKQGWVAVSEGAFPTFMGYWMKLFHAAGPGQATPSTNWPPGSPAQYCSQVQVSVQK